MNQSLYSEEEFTKFLEWVIEKGILNKETAASRKNASLQILAILDPAEKKDLRALNIDEVFTRFVNLKGTAFKADSLKVYKARFKSALGDFLSWKENPVAFKPTVAFKKSAIKNSKKPIQAEIIEPPVKTSAQIVYQSPPTPSMDVLPIRIRMDHVIQVANLPHDLTLVEAKKIARVIEAHVLDNVDA